MTNRFCFFPCPIQNKYYPLVLLGIFTILSAGMFQFDLLFGYLLGLAMFRYPAVTKLLTPSSKKIVMLENYLKRYDGKIGSKS